jgi:hypothetical protein
MPAPRASLPILAALALACLAPTSCSTAEPPAFSADSALVHVGKQLSFGPRVPGTAARDSAAAYIARTLERCAPEGLASLEIDDPHSDGRIRMMNLIAASTRAKEAAHARIALHSPRGDQGSRSRVT